MQQCGVVDFAQDTSWFSAVWGLQHVFQPSTRSSAYEPRHLYLLHCPQNIKRFSKDFRVLIFSISSLQHVLFSLLIFYHSVVSLYGLCPVIKSDLHHDE